MKRERKDRKKEKKKEKTIPKNLKLEKDREGKRGIGVTKLVHFKPKSFKWGERAKIGRKK